MAKAGALDPTFGGDRGYVVNPITSPSMVSSENYESVDAVAVQPDGKILVAGTVDEKNGVASFVLERLDTDGSLDASFGQGGLVSNVVSFGVSRFGALLVQQDGKIVEVGYTDQDFQGGVTHPSFVAIRLDADGTLDAGFGVNGVSVNPDSVANSMFGNPYTINSAVLAPDGTIVLAGGGYTSSGQAADFVSKLEPDGQLDPTFGTDGTAIVPIQYSPGLPTGASAIVAGLALQSDGQIVVAGTVNVEGANHVVITGDLIRLDADGTQDTSFGGASGGQVDFAGLDFSSLIQQPDGKLLLFDGYASLLRLNADASPDATFGQGGTVVLPYEPYSTDSIALEPNGQIVVVASFPIPGAVVGPTEGSHPLEFGSYRVNADGTLDTSYGNSPALGLALYQFGALTSTTWPPPWRSTRRTGTSCWRGPRTRSSCRTTPSPRSPSPESWPPLRPGSGSIRPRRPRPRRSTAPARPTWPSTSPSPASSPSAPKP